MPEYKLLALFTATFLVLIFSTWDDKTYLFLFLGYLDFYHRSDLCIYNNPQLFLPCHMISNTLHTHVLGGKEVLLSLSERRGDEAQRRKIKNLLKGPTQSLWWVWDRIDICWEFTVVLALDTSQAQEFKPATQLLLMAVVLSSILGRVWYAHENFKSILTQSFSASHCVFWVLMFALWCYS